MIGRGVVGDQVEQQLQVARGESLADPRERLVPPEVAIGFVGDDRERRAADVLGLEIGEHAPAFLDQLGGRAGDLPPRRPGLPDPQEPDPLESLAGDVVEKTILEIVERGGPPEGGPALLQHDARVELQQRRIPR